jgi:isoleucyl-tRNA synthetase
MPYSTALNTPFSNFEARQNQQIVEDPAVVVSFPIVGDPEGAEFLAWTTTPWTLPSNLALCVNPGMDYFKIRGNNERNIKKENIFVVFLMANNCFFFSESNNYFFLKPISHPSRSFAVSLDVSC